MTIEQENTGVRLIHAVILITFANRYLPIVFHDLRGYDSHLLMKEAYKHIDGDISVIPNSNGKFMTFKIGELKFIDSFQFMASSTEALTESLYSKK